MWTRPRPGTFATVSAVGWVTDRLVDGLLDGWMEWMDGRVD
jgi:hypothetical protein